MTALMGPKKNAETPNQMLNPESAGGVRHTEPAEVPRVGDQRLANEISIVQNLRP